MKAILAASICTVLATSAFSQAPSPEPGALPPVPPKAPDTASIPAKPEPGQAAGRAMYLHQIGEPQRFDLSFPGGTVTDFLKVVKATLGENVNVIVPKNDKALIPPLEVYRVTLGSLFRGVTQASEGRITFQTEDPPDAPGAIWTFRSMEPGEMPREVRYFPIAEYLPRFTVEDITAAVEAGWELQGERANAVVKFHEETKLLICAASSEQLALIPQVLAGLDEVPFPRSHKVIEKATKILIPRLEFRDASIPEAIEFIRRKSFELDPDQPDRPDRPDRGISIILDGDEGVAGGKLTLTLANVSVLNALQTLASMSGLELQVTDVAVILKQGAGPSGPSGKNEHEKPATTKFGSRGQLPEPGVAPVRPGSASEVPPTSSNAK